MNERFFPAFGTEQGEVYQLRIGTHFDTGLIPTYRTQYPFHSYSPFLPFT